jgi:hypothetical protein
VNITTEVEEGFMGVKIPVVKFDDGNVKFWIPQWEFERAAQVLLQAAVDYPWEPTS